jgi:hypothetical protein
MGRAMEMFTDKFGFENDDLNAVTAELSQVLDMPVELRFNDAYGGDFIAFGHSGEHGGRLKLYSNHIIYGGESDILEEKFPELGLVLLIEQRNNYVDYEPDLRKMQKFKPILLYRERYETESQALEVIFDLARERSGPS